MAIENFRSALHGFNRTDVVQFIQNQTAEHEKALRQLKEENERLQEALDAARSDLEAANADVESLRAELKANKSEAAAEPESAAPSVGGLDAPMAPVTSVVAAAPSNFNELELAAYRRAEMTERMARERAAASTERMKTIFAQADEKLTLTAQDVQTMFDTFHADFERLQQVIVTAQGIVDESSASLKASVDLCAEL